MFNRYRIFAAYIFAIPLALMLGMLVTSPDQTSLLIIAVLLFFLAFPLLIRWHHIVLILVWNSGLGANFLPSQPPLWMLMAALSFGISCLNRMVGQRPFMVVPEMNKPLLALLAVVIATAWYRGGIGFKVLGGTASGSKNYVYIFMAVMAFYAFTGKRIPLPKCRGTTALFFFTGACAVFSNIVYTLGPGFYFMYSLLPSGLAVDQARNEMGLTNIDRLIGLGPTCSAILCVLLVLYGIRGILNVAKPWRLALLFVTLGAALFAGFRSQVFFLIITLACQLYYERLLRTRLFVFSGVASIFLIGVILVFSTRMPLTVQRALSFIPIHWDSSVQADAAASTQWRLDMWSIVLKDLPKYIIIGKGYFIDPSEMYLTAQAVRDGTLSGFEGSMLAGDYHSGPLSVLIPFGLFGFLAFSWVLFAGFRVLYQNYLYGHESLSLANTTLIAFYTASMVSFFLIFGSFGNQLYIFLGLVGFSISLNGGVKKKLSPEPDFNHFSATKSFAVEAI